MINESQNYIIVDGVFTACIYSTSDNYNIKVTGGTGGGSCRASTFTSSGKY